MAENEEVITEEEEAPKSKDEMRDEPHAFADHNGWCAVCGRSAAWKAHDEGTEAAESPDEAESASVPS